MNFSDVVGMLGVASYQIAHAGLQLGRLTHSDRRYQVLNVLGPCLLIYSLTHDFNFAALVTQVLWLALTLVGVARSAFPRRGRRG